MRLGHQVIKKKVQSLVKLQNSEQNRKKVVIHSSIERLHQFISLAGYFSLKSLHQSNISQPLDNFKGATLAGYFSLKSLHQSKILQPLDNFKGATCTLYVTVKRFEKFSLNFSILLFEIRVNLPYL